MTDSLTCAQAARANHEPLTATATTPVKTWVLLEVDQPWRAKAIKDNDLPPAAQKWARAADDREDVRVQFIRQPGRAGQGVRLYIAHADERNAALYRRVLPDYDALPAVDLDDMEGATQEDGPLFVVCTNGKRDQCCALYGVAVYNALRDSDAFEVWQTTHIGGHRWAATGVLLPHGVIYGRLEEHPQALVEATARGELLLPAFRGRSNHAKPAQAAEALLREETGILGIHAFVLSDVRQREGEQWEVSFHNGEALHMVTVGRTQTGTFAPSVCSDADKPVFQWQLMAHTVLTP